MSEAENRAVTSRAPVTGVWGRCGDGRRPSCRQRIAGDGAESAGDGIETGRHYFGSRRNAAPARLIGGTSRVDSQAKRQPWPISIRTTAGLWGRAATETMTAEEGVEL